VSYSYEFYFVGC